MVYLESLEIPDRAVLDVGVLQYRICKLCLHAIHDLSRLCFAIRADDVLIALQVIGGIGRHVHQDASRRVEHVVAEARVDRVVALLQTAHVDRDLDRFECARVASLFVRHPVRDAGELVESSSRRFFEVRLFLALVVERGELLTGEQTRLLAPVGAAIDRRISGITRRRRHIVRRLLDWT